MSYFKQVQGMMHQGKSLVEACNEIGVTEKIYLRWLETREERRQVREAASLEQKGYLVDFALIAESAQSQPT